ncbi:MAG: DUF1329 domain-containing protein [Nevskiales bacterium]
MRGINLLWAAGALLLSTQPVLAKVAPEEAAKLGVTDTPLTPLGAERAANADGSIPAWTPYTPVADLKPDPVWPAEFDRYADEKPLYTITKANMAQYADKLSEGHKLLLQRYDSYKMNVYPSHRDAAWPDKIYEYTIANATKAELEGGDTDKIRNAEVGFPFPIPKTGAEPWWNHRLKWRGHNVVRFNNQAIVPLSGEIQLTKLIEEVKFIYANLEKPGKMNTGDDIFLYYLSETKAPPRIAGQLLLAWEHADFRDAWLYAPALRRIRRAPSVAYDNPYEGTDGQQFYDQVDMINGKLDRFTWKLVGKKEMIIANNSARINSPKLKYKEMLPPKHLNQDLARYELHRVWVVEANNKPDVKHTFKKKVIYFNEDTWTAAMLDNYDHRDQYYKFQEGHLGCLVTIRACGTLPEIIYDMQTGTYFATAMINEDKPYDFTPVYAEKNFLATEVVKRNTR